MKKNILRMGLYSLMISAIFLACQKRLDKAASEFGEALGAKSTTNTKRTVTGQGAFIDFDVRGTYTTNGSKTFEYDKIDAETYFTHSDGQLSNTSPFTKLNGNSGEVTKSTRVSSTTTLPDPWKTDYFGGTAPSTTQSYNPGTTCTPSDPGAPSAPAKDATKMSVVIDDNACTFLNGGDLSGTSYSKTLTSTTQKCTTVTKVWYKSSGNANQVGWWVDSTTISGTYTYTYNYSVTANEATKTVAPLTAWKEVSFNLGDGPTIPVSAFISRLQSNAQQTSTGAIDLTTTKYTFNLESQVTDPNTGLTTWVSNISNIKIEVLDALGNVINGNDGNPLVVNNPPHYIESNYNPETFTLPKKGDPYACDFRFSALSAANLTAGTTSQQLYDFNGNGTIDSADIKDAREILNTDGFANNNDGGNLGKALQKARMPAQPIQFPGTLVGEYQIRISANVAGLTSTASQTISHTQKINIIANCNGNGN